jgi:hypothetical protein
LDHHSGVWVGRVDLPLRHQRLRLRWVAEPPTVAHPPAGATSSPASCRGLSLGLYPFPRCLQRRATCLPGAELLTQLIATPIPGTLVLGTISLFGFVEDLLHDRRVAAVAVIGRPRAHLRPVDRDLLDPRTNPAS